MLENYKKSFYSISNKTPNPTNFSNSKSQRYLNDSDAENFPPSSVKHRPACNLSCNKSCKRLLADDTFSFSEHSVNDTMVPHTSKPVCRKPGHSKKSAFSPCRSVLLTLGAEKRARSVPWCPPENKGDSNAAAVRSFPEAPEKYAVRRRRG